MVSKSQSRLLGSMSLSRISWRWECKVEELLHLMTDRKQKMKKE
jgi:hypothetical protein